MKSWLPNIVAGAALHFLPESKMPNQGLRDRNCWPLQKLRSARWPPPSTRILQMPFSEETRGSRQHSAKLCHCLRAEPCLGNWQLISVCATGSVRSPIFFVFFPHIVCTALLNLDCAGPSLTDIYLALLRPRDVCVEYVIPRRR